LSGEGKTENKLLLAERFGTVFLIDLIYHLVAKTTSHQDYFPPKQADNSNSTYNKRAS
jgi:hypothetical protein